MNSILDKNNISLPDSLVSKLPSDDLISIVNYGNKTKSDENRRNTTPDFTQLDDTYIQYRVKRDADLVFMESFHPFIGRHSTNVSMCSKNVLKYLGCRPFFFDITKEMLCVLFDGGYHTCTYKETSDYIMYRDFYHESYHDGGGSGDTTWYLYTTSVEKTETVLYNDRYLGWCVIPECKGYWYEGERLYLVDPFDIPGVFEYYCCSITRRDYDSEDVCKEIGVKL